MSTGWSIYITVLSVLNILGCLWLLWWTSQKRAGGTPANETTGHTWDGDLTEYNKPLPKWWLNLFYLTIIFSAVYLVLYPGLGAFAGTRKWTSTDQLRADIEQHDARLAPIFARFASLPIDELARDPEALALGRSVFANNCATCHGSDARGARGYPNLTDGDWLWGGDADAIVATIAKGRNAVMPALGGALGDDGVAATAAFVQSLAGVTADPGLVRTGEIHFKTLCVACHGPDGKGNPLLGAPNLTDGTWLYGEDFASISASIANGRNGQMPAQEPIIGTDRARLAAAWVYSLRDAGQTASGAGGGR
jgi:cytochrome c oxidase cbb3-type subunit 3